MTYLPRFNIPFTLLDMRLVMDMPSLGADASPSFETMLPSQGPTDSTWCLLSDDVRCDQMDRLY